MTIVTEQSNVSELVTSEACLVQKSLLPPEPLLGPNFEITYLLRAFSEVGGDFLDYFYLSDGKLGIYVGDVTGKGLPAAMYAALAVGALRSVHKTGVEPAAVLNLLNKRLLVRPVPSRYCATQYAIFDSATLELRLANAGLPLPLHLSANGCSPIGDGGLPSGLFDFASYVQGTFQLAQGDAVLFATDGLSEARNKRGESFGMSRLTNLCAKLDYHAPDLFLRSVFDAIAHFTEGQQSDDMAAVLLTARPRCASTAGSPLVAAEQGQASEEGTDNTAPTEMPKGAMPRLLIVDDDDSMRKLLRLRLGSSYEITDTPDPEEGIALALQQKPDAILLDLMMPKHSGFEVCQTLSSLSFTQRIPILIVSGESVSRYRDFCENVGAKGFFSKPIDFTKLGQALVEVIQDTRRAEHGEPRVRLKTALELRGVNTTQAPFEVIAVTESITANGFSCELQVDLKEGAVIDVYLATKKEESIGRARVIHVGQAGAPRHACDFEFLEKPANWILDQ